MMERNLVLVVGDCNLDLRPFEQRGLGVKRVTVNDAPNDFGKGRAVVVADYPDKFGLIKECYSTLFPKAEDHGLTLVVMVHSKSNFIQVAALRQEDFSTSPSTIRLIGNIEEVSESIRQHCPGPPAGKVIFEPESIDLTGDERLLLQRAFCDCDRIHLDPLFGGKVSFRVFRVHAWLKQSEVGPCPLPFFVKIGTPKDVGGEMDKYREYATHYIPYHLRPNLDAARYVCTRYRACTRGRFCG